MIYEGSRDTEDWWNYAENWTSRK